MDATHIPFDFQPTLRSSLLTLRPLLLTDSDALWQRSSDPLIWEQLPRSERYKKDVFQRFFDESIKLQTTLAILEKKSGNIIGSSRYARFDAVKSEVEIGWTFLAREFWGTGLNAESKRMMIDHSFRFVESVFLVAAASNTRSRKAIEKLGAIKEQELDWPPGVEIQDPSVLYRIRKSNW